MFFHWFIKFTIFSTKHLNLFWTSLPGLTQIYLGLSFQIWIIFYRINRLIQIRQFLLKSLLLLLCLHQFLPSHIFLISILWFANWTITGYFYYRITINNLFFYGIIKLLYPRLREELILWQSLAKQVL